MLPYARPSIGAAELEEVAACLRSGWLATGPRVARFEEQLALRVASPCAVATCTGTAALHLAIVAAGIEPGDEVITTPMTWVATANVLLHAGAVPVFADVVPGTLNLDVRHVAAAITPRTRAILPVHFAGQPCDEDALLDLARSRKLRLIEDAAHALGASYKGRPIGSIGDATMFSFHPAKNITTGEGGALTTADEDLAERARRLRFHGIAATPESRFGGRGPAAYDVVEAGFKYNMSDLQAAIGIHQLERLAAMNRRRRELADRYRAALASLRFVAPLEDAPYEHVHAWHLMVVQIEPEALAIARDDLIQELRARGVGAGLHFVPLHLQTLYRGRDAYPAGLPAATEAHRRILTLPLFSDMRDAEVDFVVEVLDRILREHVRASTAPKTEGGALA